MVIFLFFLFTLLPKQSNRQGGAKAMDLQARSFDLARLGVAPPLIWTGSFGSFSSFGLCFDGDD